MSRILVIDDDKMVCQMLRHALEPLGFVVSEAHDGREGLAVHKAAPADLLITDLIMPGMEGIETIIEFKRQAPGLKIVAISGGGRVNSAEYLEIAKKFGAHETLRKPFTITHLVSVVTKLLAGAPAPGS